MKLYNQNITPEKIIDNEIQTNVHIVASFELTS
jgi:hypothetical protein